jgi:hypothetical protein
LNSLNGRCMSRRLRGYRKREQYIQIHTYRFRYKRTDQEQWTGEQTWREPVSNIFSSCPQHPQRARSSFSAPPPLTWTVHLTRDTLGETTSPSDVVLFETRALCHPNGSLR